MTDYSTGTGLEHLVVFGYFWCPGVLGVGDEDMKIARVSLGGLVPTSIDRPS